MIDNQESIHFLHKIVGFGENACKGINTSCIISNEILHEHKWIKKIKAEVYRLPFGGIKINQNHIFEV